MTSDVTRDPHRRSPADAACRRGPPVTVRATGHRSASTPQPASPRPEHFPHLLPELTDGRVLLRAWRTSDAAALTAMARDEQCQRWCIGLPRPYSLTDAQHFIGTSKGAWELWGLARFAVVDAREGTLLASVAMKPIEEAGGEIGYMAAAGARGRGVTVAALRLLAGWAFDQLRMERLEALIQPANLASIRTAERAGFMSRNGRRSCCSITGERREHAVWVLAAPVARPR